MEKQCTKCKEIKPLSDFYQRKNGIVDSRCKVCHNEDCKCYVNKNKEKTLNRIKEWSQNNREKTRIAKTKWRKKNADYHKEYYKKRVNEDPFYNSNLYLKNVEKHRAGSKRYRQAHPKHNQEYIKRRLETDDNFRLARNLRHRIIYALKLSKTKKETPTTKLIGCTIEDLKIYIESMFSPTMTWENYGSYWQIDHIIPCINFDLTKLEEQYKCFHYTNLQPLFTVTTTINGITYLGNRNKGKKLL